MSDTSTTDDAPSGNYTTAVAAVREYLDEHVDRMDYVRSSHLADDLEFNSKQIGHALSYLAAEEGGQWAVTKWSGKGSSPITWHVERRAVADGDEPFQDAPANERRERRVAFCPDCGIKVRNMAGKNRDDEHVGDWYCPEGRHYIREPEWRKVAADGGATVEYGEQLSEIAGALADADPEELHGAMLVTYSADGVDTLPAVAPNVDARWASLWMLGAHIAHVAASAQRAGGNATMEDVAEDAIDYVRAHGVGGEQA